MAIQYEYIESSIEDGVAWVTLNRPDKFNAFAGDMRDELLHALMAIQEQDEARCIVIRGAGRAFCSGGDVASMVELKANGDDFEPIARNMEKGSQIVRLLHEYPRPVIAMVNGVAAGAGMNLALACDLRIGGENARFAASFINVGLHADWGGSYFLPRIVGLSRALELLWSGRTVEAEEAQSLGLLTELVPHAQLLERTKRLAQQMAAAPTTAVHLMKLAVYQSAQFDLDGMMEFELEAQHQCWASPDSAEGLKAFVEKRKPRFH
jgi:2-(1,2-epoxy-1,2-dihydrophenyl)acetyl-CoA isomerase